MFVFVRVVVHVPAFRYIYKYIHVCVYIYIDHIIIEELYDGDGGEQCA